MMSNFIRQSQLNLPTKVVVFNNGSQGFIAMGMKAGGYFDTCTYLTKTDVAAIAAAMGAASFWIIASVRRAEAVKAACPHSESALVSVFTANQALALPPNIQFEQANKGFGLYMLKATFNGRAMVAGMK